MINKGGPGLAKDCSACGSAVLPQPPQPYREGNETSMLSRLQRVIKSAKLQLSMRAIYPSLSFVAFMQTMAHISDQRACGQSSVKKRKLANFETPKLLIDATEQQIRSLSIGSTLVGRSPERLFTTGPYQRDNILTFQSPDPISYLDEHDDSISGWSSHCQNRYRWPELLGIDIRLLPLSPGEPNRDSIECALQHVHLNIITEPKYRSIKLCHTHRVREVVQMSSICTTCPRKILSQWMLV